MKLKFTLLFLVSLTSLIHLIVADRYYLSLTATRYNSTAIRWVSDVYSNVLYNSASHVGFGTSSCWYQDNTEMMTAMVQFQYANFSYSFVMAEYSTYGSYLSWDGFIPCSDCDRPAGEYGSMGFWVEGKSLLIWMEYGPCTTPSNCLSICQGAE